MRKLLVLVCLAGLTSACVGPTTSTRLTSQLAAPLEAVSILQQRTRYRIACTFRESCEVEAHRVCPAGFREVGKTGFPGPNATQRIDGAANPGARPSSSWWFVQRRTGMSVECF